MRTQNNKLALGRVDQPNHYQANNEELQSIHSKFRRFNLKQDEPLKAEIIMRVTAILIWFILVKKLVTL